MNAPAQIRAAPFDLNAAHMEAHKWVEIARPLIKAYLALDHMQADVLAASRVAHQYYAGQIKFAADNRIAATMNGFIRDIEGIRDQWIGELSPPSPNRSIRVPGDDALWDEYDDLCEMWAERCRDVASVDSAIDRAATGLSLDQLHEVL